MKGFLKSLDIKSRAFAFRSGSVGEKIPCGVIVGRPNVGKSSLFNRLIGERRSLVHNFPGVTRDRIEGEALWWLAGQAYPVRWIDTGGLLGNQFSQDIENQIKIALDQADFALWVMDSQAGITPDDLEIDQIFKRSGLFKKIPFFLVLSKVDHPQAEDRISDFYQLSASCREIFMVSSEHARGIEGLKDGLLEHGVLLPLSEEETELEKNRLAEKKESQSSTEQSSHRIARVCIVGKPNVGKSSLLNALLNEERVITSPIAGTTIDAVDTLLESDGEIFQLVDTAGIRRKSKTEQGVEVLSALQSKKALERSDLALLVVDGSEGVADQDEKIAGMIQEAGCSLILLVNKWDQIKDPKFTQEMAAQRIRSQMSFLHYAPILFISALTGEGLQGLTQLWREVLEARHQKINTKELTEHLRSQSKVHNPKNARFYFCHQSGKNPPTFVCHVNDADKIDFSLKRHLINALRGRYGYLGAPIKMVFVSKKITK